METGSSEILAETPGNTLPVAGAQQKREVQIMAIRTFNATGVDSILLGPVIAFQTDVMGLPKWHPTESGINPPEIAAGKHETREDLF